MKSMKRFSRNTIKYALSGGRLLVSRLNTSRDKETIRQVQQAMKELKNADSDLTGIPPGTIVGAMLGNVPKGYDYRNDLVLSLVQVALLFTSGNLWRLDRCPACQKWLLKRTKYTVTCSPACRLKHWRDTEEQRKERHRQAEEKSRNSPGRRKGRGNQQ
jgi:hypothetical protein